VRCAYKPQTFSPEIHFSSSSSAGSQRAPLLALSFPHVGRGEKERRPDVFQVKSYHVPSRPCKSSSVFVFNMVRTKSTTAHMGNSLINYSSFEPRDSKTRYAGTTEIPRFSRPYFYFSIMTARTFSLYVLLCRFVDLKTSARLWCFCVSFDCDVLRHCLDEHEKIYIQLRRVASDDEKLRLSNRFVFINRHRTCFTVLQCRALHYYYYYAFIDRKKNGRH